MRRARYLTMLCLAACADTGRAGMGPETFVTPRYGDYIFPIDSFTVPERVRSGDTLQVVLYPRAPHGVCPPWTVIWHTGRGVRITLYGIHAPDMAVCRTPVARVRVMAWDKDELYPVRVFQPDSSSLLRHVLIEAVPMPISTPAPAGAYGDVPSDSAAGPPAKVRPTRPAPKSRRIRP